MRSLEGAGRAEEKDVTASRVDGTTARLVDAANRRGTWNLCHVCAEHLRLSVQNLG